MTIHLVVEHFSICSRLLLCAMVVGFACAAVAVGSVFAQDVSLGERTTISAASAEEATVRNQISLQQQRLSSNDVEERRDAVLKLGWIKRPESSRIAASALNDPNEKVRAAACAAVLSLPPDEAVSVLMPALSDKRPFVRQEAAFALGQTRSGTAALSLINTLQTDEYLNVRAAAALALGQIGAATSVDVLSATLKGVAEGKIRDKDKNEFEFLRRSAAVALGQIGSRSGVPALIDALGRATEPDDVRREAARSLGVIADPSSIPALKAVLADRDPYLSRIAQDGLDNIKGQPDQQ
ncbi:MAG: HEAT repeat domain-containing protein [Pyrinomonadaceae bacterium]